MKKRFNLASETFRDKVQKYTKEYKYNTTEKNSPSKLTHIPIYVINI